MSAEHEFMWLRRSRIRQLERLLRAPSHFSGDDSIRLLRQVVAMLRQVIDQMAAMPAQISAAESHADPDGGKGIVVDARVASGIREAGARNSLSPAGLRILQSLAASSGIFVPYAELIRDAALISRSDTNIRVHVSHVRAVLSKNGLHNAIKTSHRSYALRSEYRDKVLSFLQDMQESGA